MVALARQSTEQEGASSKDGVATGVFELVGATFGAVVGSSRCQSLPVAAERRPESKVVPSSWIEAVVASKCAVQP